MTGLRGGPAVGLLVLLGACAVGVLAPGPDGARAERAAPAEPVREPGGTAGAARLAAQEPDEYAWRLFLYLSRQALPHAAGIADPRKPSLRDYDDDRDVVWESWALVSSDANEVFLPKGAKPVAWDKLDRGGAAARHHKLDTNRLLQIREPHLPGAEPPPPDKPRPNFVPPAQGGFEVRMNRATFDMIRDNELYSREGLAAAFQNARAANNRDYLQFPPAAKEVKACWIMIRDADRPRYHWRAVNGQAYGLAALHITTKDLPFWFWCDFIHTDEEPYETPDSVHDATTRGPGAPHGKDGVRDETLGGKWRYYRLKGSQTGFTDARGRPTSLGNKLLEGPNNVPTSSCITCHAMAGIDKAGQPYPGRDFFTGLPRTADFGDKEMLRLQTDFVYSLARAHSVRE